MLAEIHRNASASSSWSTQAPAVRAIIRGASRGQGHIDLRGSVFCQVRDRVTHPLCEYYAAALRHLLHRFELPHGAQAKECRAAGAARCLIALLASDGQAEA